MTVQGSSVSVATGSSALSAIDTGTTLIGGPSADVAAIYAAIPGSQAVQGQGGFYAFRTSLFSNFNCSHIYSCHAACTTNVSITLAFGGKAWPIKPSDMNLGRVSSGSSYCAGGIFDLTAGSNIPVGSGNPSWVVGDTFLKNVYSVYRSSPPSVGFAALSSAAGGSGAGAWFLLFLSDVTDLVVGLSFQARAVLLLGRVREAAAEVVVGLRVGRPKVRISPMFV